MVNFPTNICIVDDDTDFVSFLAEYFQLRGCFSSIFNSAEEFLVKGDISGFDFFIIDLGLPGLDGVDLTTLIRARSGAGILVVSGRLGADAFNSALAAGADMFVNKPVRFDQVSHAIASIWRRFPKPVSRHEAWSLSADGARLIAPLGRTVSLTPVEGRLIEKLRAHGVQPVARADLATAAGISESNDQRNLDAAFFRLRRKIERAAEVPSPFRTVHGFGYQMIENIEDDNNGTK